ncbi:MAG: hypothetical protein MI755_04145 [Sphingomonadales bacterium]|nr:hypothetical protein [Sphingomonadales bacterium]
MPAINTVNLDSKTYELLRLRAAKNGVSMEEKVRDILQNAVKAPERLGDVMLRRFGPDHGVELKFPVHKPHEPPEFGD